MVKIDDSKLLANVSVESIKSRMIQTALIELLIEKNLITEDEINSKIEKVRAEKNDMFAAELMDMTKEDFLKELEKIDAD